jgi:hypothetical protein
MSCDKNSEFSNYGDFKIDIDPCFDRGEIKRSYSMKELGTILD